MRAQKTMRNKRGQKIAAAVVPSSCVANLGLGEARAHYGTVTGTEVVFGVCSCLILHEASMNRFELHFGRIDTSWTDDLSNCRSNRSAAVHVA